MKFSGAAVRKVFWRLAPPKNFFLNAYFVHFAKQNEQNTRSENIYSAAEGDRIQNSRIILQNYIKI